MLSEDFRELLVSFEQMYLRNSFCHTTNIWNKHEIVGFIGSLWENLSFSSPLELLKSQIL